MRARRDTSRAAAKRAASQLMRTGLDCATDLRSNTAIEWLADIAEHIHSNDPTDIGAAAILESSGYDRGNVQLTLAITTQRAAQ
jgi:formiminotetrahydrofolate cyclodeaminase